MHHGKKGVIKREIFYLESHFGAYSISDLVDDLCVQTAAVVHVSHYDREKLNTTNSTIITLTLGKYSKNFTAAHLRWTRLLGSNVGCTKPVGGVS